MTRTRTAALATALALTIAACSSGSDAGPSSESLEDYNDRNSIETPTVPTTEAPVESDPEPAVTDPPTTTATPATDVEPATSVPAVTDPPTTTAAANTPEAEVIVAIEFFEQQWKTCLEQLPNCDLDAVTARRGIDDVGVIEAEAIRFNGNDYRASNIDAYTYSPTNVVVDGTTATAEVCVTDPIAITEADGTVVDDLHYSYVLDWTLSKPADVWIVESRQLNGDSVVGEENDLCAAN